MSLAGRIIYIRGGCYLAGYGIIFCNDSNVFPVMQVQMDVQKALDDTRRKLAVMAAQEGEDHEKIVGMAATNVLFKKNIKKSDNINHYVVNKVAGINLLKSKFTEDKIYLVASYGVKMRCGCPESRILKSDSMSFAVSGQDGWKITVIWRYGCMWQKRGVYIIHRENVHI